MAVNAAWERAARHGDVEALEHLIRAGVDIDARDRHGQTALMLAAHHGQAQAVTLLAEHGADLNATAKYNLSALMLAIIAGHVAVARILAAAGADLTITGRGAPGFSGKTAHDLAAAHGLEELRDALVRRGAP